MSKDKNNVVGIDGKPHKEAEHRKYNEITDVYQCDECEGQNLLLSIDLEIYCHECTHFIAKIETVFTR